MFCLEAMSYKGRSMKDKKQLLYIVITIIGIIIRALFRDYQSDDWTRCWIPWMEALDGEFSKVATFPGDYNAPYVTLIWIINRLPIQNLYGVKLLSVMFDYILAIGAAKLVSCCVSKEKADISGFVAYGVIVCSPVVILNSSWWAQCDSIYTACLIWSLYFFVKNKDVKGMVLFGCAIAAKLQAIIALPLLIIYWWKNKKFSILYFLIIPITVEILCLPAIIAGCSPFITITQYLGQTSEYQYLFHLYPNIWALLHGASYWICIDLAIVGITGVFAIMLLCISVYGKTINQETLLLFSVFIIMTALFFLPQMHERYGYFLEILFICLAIKEQKHIIPAVIINALTILFYKNGSSIMFEKIVTYPTGTLYIICYMWILYCSYKELFVREKINADY